MNSTEVRVDQMTFRCFQVGRVEEEPAEVYPPIPSSWFVCRNSNLSFCSVLGDSSQDRMKN